MNPRSSAENTGKTADSKEGGAESGAPADGGAVGTIDPDLMKVIEAWPGLPEAIRRGIVAMVMPA